MTDRRQAGAASCARFTPARFHEALLSAGRKLVDQVVVNHGTRPLDDLYFDLKPLSRNGGEVDYPSLIAGQPQAVDRNPDGRFRLCRIGDAVAARNTHAAIHNALRLVKDL